MKNFTALARFRDVLVWAKQERLKDKPIKKVKPSVPTQQIIKAWKDKKNA